MYRCLFVLVIAVLFQGQATSNVAFEGHTTDFDHWLRIFFVCSSVLLTVWRMVWAVKKNVRMFTHMYAHAHICCLFRAPLVCNTE